MRQKLSLSSTTAFRLRLLRHSLILSRPPSVTRRHYTRVRLSIDVRRYRFCYFVFFNNCIFSAEEENIFNRAHKREHRLDNPLVHWKHWISHFLFALRFRHVFTNGGRNCGRDTMVPAELGAIVVFSAALYCCCVTVVEATGGPQKPIQQNQIPPLQTTRKSVCIAAKTLIWKKKICHRTRNVYRY